MAKKLAMALLALLACLLPTSSAAHGLNRSHWGPAVLGATEADWIHRYGRIMANTGSGLDGWHPCATRPQQAGLLVMFAAGRATTITGQGCPGQLFGLALRIRQAQSLFPPHSVRHGTVNTQDGPAPVYYSSVLAREVPRDLFLDCDSNQVTPGTFVLNPRYSGGDWALTVGTCG